MCRSLESLDCMSIELVEKSFTMCGISFQLDRPGTGDAPCLKDDGVAALVGHAAIFELIGREWARMILSPSMDVEDSKEESLVVPCKDI